MKTLNGKLGVSLVAVLLFMMIATIAATATYKLLTSENWSSAARLQKSEAYQSSQAGLESTRSWMTYHASDVGSLIKQYKQGGNKPIPLNSRLKELSRADQEYSVWLVGVNTENSTYKLKILSSGKGRNGSVYNQVGIFNVDGLYQVTVTKKKRVANVDFDYAYFGGSYTGAGNVTISSAVVNGNWSGNPQNVTNNFFITGNAELSGNNVNVGNLACIGGDMSIGNNGINANDLYVGGNAMNVRVTAGGDAYFEGNISQSSTGPMTFNKSVTLNGTMTTNQSGGSYYVDIKENLCLTNNGKIVSTGTNANFEVAGNVWMPGHNQLYTGRTGTDNYDKVILGSSENSKLYIADGHPYSDYTTLRNNKKFRENKDYKKYCAPEKQISSKDKWDIVIGNGGDDFIFKPGEKDICGSWDRPYWKSKGNNDKEAFYPFRVSSYYENWPGYYVVYNYGWTNWSNGTTPEYEYQPYETIESKPNLFYFYYNAPGVQDVEFKQYSTNWKHYTAADAAREILLEKYAGEDSYYGNPYWEGASWKRKEYRGFWPKQGGDQISAKFANTTDVGAYFVGGQQFYDFTTKQYNNYNISGFAAAWSGGPLNPVPTGSPYCYHSTDEYRPVCKVSNWFMSKGSVVKPMPATMPNDAKCAESVKDKCMDVLGDPTTGCEGSKFKVPDMLVTAYDKFEPYSRKGCADTITTWGRDLVKKMNACYAENSADEIKQKTNLYNGYLVVKVDGGAGTEKCPTEALNGKFVLIVNDAPIDCQNGLPPAPDGSDVMLYLNKGATNIGGTTTKNYFIYTKDKIQSAKQLNLIGTIYATAESCAGVGDMQSSTLTYDPELMSEMILSGLVCSNDGNQCGGAGVAGDDPAGSSSSGDIDDVSIEVTDSYYVSNAPTLAVSLETQYRSDETLPTDAEVTTLAGDFVVVPRVIYLTKDPYGELKDYYNVIGLNGLNITKDESAVTCDGSSGIHTSGKLYNRDGSDSKLPRGEFECSYTYQGITVPFYVNIDGESGSTPFIKFTESSVEMGTNTNYEVKIKVPPHSAVVKVDILRPNDIANWVINPVNGNCSGNKCTFDIPANPDNSEITVFTVKTENADNGTAMFQLSAGEGYIIGTPGTIVLTYKAKVNIERIEASSAEIAAYCSSHSDCPSNQDAWPNCNFTEPWIKANANCNTLTLNSLWSCPLTADIALEATNSVAGCVTIIPDNVLSKEIFAAGENYRLPASLKARPMQFRVGFSGEDLYGKVIRISVPSRSIDMDCSYGSDVSSTTEYCSIEVFKGESIRLSILNNPDNFNYWSCEGASCPASPYPSMVYDGIVVSENNNTAVAHFDETDKHCFFDEFKTGAGCNNDKYCISEASEKWSALTADFTSKLDYQHGYVAAKSNKNDKEGVIVLSNVEPGLKGTLKAQFQVPQVPSGTSSKTLTTIQNSGFILRSNANATSYLLLSFYINGSGYLTASLCSSNGSDCKEKRMSMSASTSTVITLSADINTTSINISAVSNRLGASSPYSAEFNFEEDGFTGFANTGSHIGFRLADPGFKLYDIGWKSEDYGSECWDTYPTVNCSFKSAYIGGLVPLNASAKPWVGLSSWFNTRDCSPSYYYIGDDACGGSTSTLSKCFSDEYVFSEKGAHGYIEADRDIRTAKAGVGNCYALGDDKDRMLAETELAHCGEFWVGELSYCKENVQFFTGDKRIYSGDPETINLNSGVYVNVREATLKVEVSNPDAAQIEIYLLSQNDTYSRVYHSKSFETTATGTIDISVETLIDAEGFDPEHVYGLTVAVLSGYGSYIDVKAVYTACPNVVSLTCQPEISYDATAGVWRFAADMTNFTMAKAFKVSEMSSLISGSEYDCTANPSECPAQEFGKNATYAFTLEDNPYNGNTGRDYQFRVELTTMDDKILTCETNSLNIPDISALCGQLSTTSVKTGAGLPQFSYVVANCPTTGCPFKITLDGESIDIKTGNGNDPNGSTPTSAANTSTDPLAPGTYKFKLESTGENTSFTSCNSAEFTVRSAAADYDVECGVSENNWNISGGSVFYTTQELNFVAKIIASEENEVSFKVLQDGTNVGSATVNKYGYTNARRIGNLAKGTYKYSLTYANEEICSHTVEIKDPADETTASCNTVNVYPGTSTGALVTMANTANLSSATTGKIKIGDEVKKSNSCGNSGCGDMEFTAPSTVGSYEYGFYLNDDAEPKCTGTINVSSVLSCFVDKTDIKLGESFTFWPNYGGSCGGATFNGENANYGYCMESYTIEPKTIGNDKEYTFSITNGSIGNGSCTVKINVSEDAPTASCPTTALSVEPGQNAAFEPSSVTGCSAVGCDYTIKKNGSTVAGVNDKSYKGGATTPRAYEAGTYTFEVKNSAGTSTPCEFKVALKKPEVDCSGIGEIQIEPKDVVKFKPSISYCSNCTYSVASVATVNTSSTGEFSFTDLGKLGTGFEYTFTATNSAGSAECSIVVKYKAPTVECPDDLNVEPGANAAFTLKSQTNCNNGCSYTLEDMYQASVTMSSSDGKYTFTSDNSAGKTNYTFKAANVAGQSAKCDFNVNYLEPNFVCPDEHNKVAAGIGVPISLTVANCDMGCDYNLSGSTGSNYTGGLIKTITEEGDYSLMIRNAAGSKTCYFNIEYVSESELCHAPSGCENPVTSGSFSYNGSCYFATSINYMNSPSTYIINGDSRTGWQGNNSWPAKKDGGYYIQTENSSDYGSALTLGTPDCSGGSGSGGSGGGSGSTSVSASAVEFTPGTYSITCSGGGQLICWNPNGGEFEFTFDGSPCKAYGGEGWGSCGGGTCSSSQKTLTTSKTVRCKGGW